MRLRCSPRRLVGVVLLLAGLAGFVHCGASPASRRQRPLTDEETVAPFVDDQEKPPTPAPDWRIYVDCSESMRGFAAANGIYAKVFDDIADLLAASAGVATKARYFGFGPTIVEYTNRGDRWFQRAGRTPAEYSYPHTDIGMVIGEVVAWQSPPEVALLVTDGVQSMPELAGNTPLITETSRWLSWGYEFGIIAVRTSFNGEAFSEAAGDAKMGTYTGGRPFYVFVFATNRGAYNRVFSAVSRSITGKDTTRRDSVRSVLLTGKMLKDGLTRIKGPSGRPNVFRGGPRGKTKPVAHLYWSGDPQLCGPGGLSVAFDVAVDSLASNMLPAKGRNFICAVRQKSWLLGEKLTPTELSVDVKDTRVASDRTGNRRIFNTRLVLGNVDTPGRHIVRSDVVLTSENLIVPSWVDSFSVADDRSVSDYGRTYNFDRLVHALMTRTSFNDQLIGTVYVEFFKPPVR
jgi:hypothetical protein